MSLFTHPHVFPNFLPLKKNGDIGQNAHAALFHTIKVNGTPQPMTFDVIHIMWMMTNGVNSANS